MSSCINEGGRALDEIWRQAFGIAEIGVYDTFFELGGSSLLASHILPRIEDTL